MARPSAVRIVEVGPRDGLQNEHAAIGTAEKIGFVNRLTEAGLTSIEVSAFVSPKWVPQMADAAEVFAAITRRGDRPRRSRPGVTSSGSTNRSIAC